MSDDWIFAKEESTIKSAEGFLSSGGLSDEMNDAFSTLLDAYIKLSHQMKKLIALNDRQAQRLVEKNEALAVQTEEAEKQAGLARIARLEAEDLRIDAETHAQAIDGINAFLESIFASMTDSIIVIDVGETIVQWNQRLCELLGYNEAELSRKPFRELLPPTELLALTGLETVLRELDVIAFNTNLVAKDGSEISVVLRGSVLESTGSGVTGYVLVVSNNNETRELMLQQSRAMAQLAQTREIMRDTQKRLIESERLAAVGQLMMGMAHEVNTPLGVGITAETHLHDLTRELDSKIDDGTLKKAELKNFLGEAVVSTQLVVRNLARIARLMDNFKLLAADGESTRIARVNLSVLLESLLADHRQLLGDEGIDLSMECDLSIEMTTAPAILESVLVSLVTNAKSHAFGDTDRKTISVTGVMNGPYRVNITVRDSGCGIVADDLPRIFDPFFTTRRDKGHVGLGLHLAYNQINGRLHGTIDCRSTVGEGTCFVIELPARYPGEAVDPEPAP